MLTLIYFQKHQTKNQLSLSHTHTYIYIYINKKRKQTLRKNKTKPRERTPSKPTWMCLIKTHLGIRGVTPLRIQYGTYNGGITFLIAWESTSASYVSTKFIGIYIHADLRLMNHNDFLSSFLNFVLQLLVIHTLLKTKLGLQN